MPTGRSSAINARRVTTSCTSKRDLSRPLSGHPRHRAQSRCSRLTTQNQFSSTVKRQWHRWPPTRRDSGFRSVCAITRVMEHNMEKRIKSMSEAKAQLVLAALSNSKTLNQICGGRLNGRYSSGEKITDYRLYQNYCADHPDFSREAQALLAENMKASN